MWPSCDVCGTDLCNHEKCINAACINREPCPKCEKALDDAYDTYTCEIRTEGK